jgi:hypothetical protein
MYSKGFMQINIEAREEPSVDLVARDQGIEAKSS